MVHDNAFSVYNEKNPNWSIFTECYISLPKPLISGKKKNL